MESLLESALVALYLLLFLLLVAAMIWVFFESVAAAREYFRKD